MMNSNFLGPLKLFFAVFGRLMPSLAMRAAVRLFITVPYSKRRENELELLSSAEKFMVLMDNGHQLAVYRWGNKTDPIVLFVHGWTATATCFCRVIERLVEDGFQVISYDAVAHGGSTGRTTTLPEWAHSVQTVNDAIGPVHCIIGHSIGSAAIILASSAGLDTQKLVLLSPATNVHDILQPFAKMLSMPKNIRNNLAPYLWQKYSHLLTKYGQDWEDIFTSDFEVPTLIVHDVNDKEVDIRNARWLAQQWPWAELVETERLGHRRILLSQKVITKVTDFLQAPEPKV